jgi:hypothetical protein
MTDGYEGYDSGDIKVINTKLDYIAAACLEFKTFIKDFDKIFSAKYEEKKKSCPGFVWCEDGIKEFKVLKNEFALHKNEHETQHDIDESVINNRRWLMGLLIMAGLNFAALVYKIFKGG